jgi:hypothetical protein
VRQLDAVLSLQREAGRRTFPISATVETAEDLAAVARARRLASSTPRLSGIDLSV